MQSGWIKIHRQLLSWEWFDKPEMVQIYLYLLLKANQVDKVWHGITIRRGQVLTSLATIGRDLKISERTIRTCLKRLKSTSEVTTETTNRYTIVTICNYEIYQGENLYSDEQNDTRADILTTNKRQANDKQATSGTYNSTNNSIYNNTIVVNKNEKNNNLSSEEDKSVFSADADAPTVVKSEVVDKKESFPFKKIKDEWNTICTAYPKLHVLSESRKNKIRNRIEEMGGVEGAMPLIKLIFEKMMASPFLRGDNPRGWKASFDWVFTNDKNWVKIYEGTYDPRPTANQTITTPKLRYNGKTDVYSNGNAGYEARQRIFRKHIREKLDSPDRVEPDITGYY